MHCLLNIHEPSGVKTLIQTRVGISHFKHPNSFLDTTNDSCEFQLATGHGAHFLFKFKFIFKSKTLSHELCVKYSALKQFTASTKER